MQTFLFPRAALLSCTQFSGAAAGIKIEIDVVRARERVLKGEIAEFTRVSSQPRAPFSINFERKFAKKRKLILNFAMMTDELFSSLLYSLLISLSPSGELCNDKAKKIFSFLLLPVIGVVVRLLSGQSLLCALLVGEE